MSSGVPNQNAITDGNQAARGRFCRKPSIPWTEHFFGCSSLLQFGYGTWADVLEGKSPAVASTAEFHAVDMCSLFTECG
jgi:hypothetical protein